MPEPRPGLHERNRLDPVETITLLAVWVTPLLVGGLFLWILVELALHGLQGFEWSFLVEPVARSGREGGIGPLLVSTGLILCVCLAVVVPLGLPTALLLAEYPVRGSRYADGVRLALDVLAGVPSIVFGLFGNALFCNYLGLGFSILSGGLTLACMVLPLFIRSAEEGFRSVPEHYRTGALALGISRTRLLLYLQLPAAAPGLAVGLVLGIGRALAETAALLYTSGYVTRTPSSLSDSGRTLSVHIYDLAMIIPGGGPNAYKTALVLLVLLVAINAITYWAAEHGLRNRILSV